MQTQQVQKKISMTLSIPLYYRQDSRLDILLQNCGRDLSLDVRLNKEPFLTSKKDHFWL